MWWWRTVASDRRGRRRWRLPRGAAPWAAAIRRAGRHRKTSASSGRGCGAPRVPSGSLLTRSWTSGPTAPPGVGAGRTTGRRTDGRQWVWTAGTEKPKEPAAPTGSTYLRVRVGYPRQGALGAPSPRQAATGRSSGSEHRQGLPVDLSSTIPPRRATTHAGFQTSTSGSVRVQTAPAVRRVRRPGSAAGPGAAGHGRGCRRPRAVRLPPHNSTMTSGPTAPPGVGAGKRTMGRDTDGRQWVWTAGPKNRRNPQHPPDRRTNASASAIPVRAPGAPLPHDNRPRAGLSVATVGRRSCRRTSGRRYRPRRAITMRNPDPHDGSGARRHRACRSTSTTPRVRTDAAARAACRRPCPGRHLPRARGSRATRGPRPPPQEHSRTATDRRPPTLPDAAETTTGSSGPQPPCATGFSLNPTPNTATPMTTKENPCATTAEPPPNATATPSPSSGAASRKSSSERAANGSRLHSRATSRSEFRVFLCRDADEAAACLHRHWWGKRGPEPGDGARPPARGVPAHPRRGLRALERHLPAVRRCLEAGVPAVRASRPGGRPPAGGTHRLQHAATDRRGRLRRAPLQRQ